jgi:hypothetical protein
MVSLILLPISIPRKYLLIGTGGIVWNRRVCNEYVEEKVGVRSGGPGSIPGTTKKK